MNRRFEAHGRVECSTGWVRNARGRRGRKSAWGSLCGCGRCVGSREWRRILTLLLPGRIKTTEAPFTECNWAGCGSDHSKSLEEILDRLRSKHRATGSRTWRKDSLSHKTTNNKTEAPILCWSSLEPPESLADLWWCTIWSEANKGILTLRIIPSLHMGDSILRLQHRFLIEKVC